MTHSVDVFVDGVTDTSFNSPVKSFSSICVKKFTKCPQSRREDPDIFYRRPNVILYYSTAKHFLYIRTGYDGKLTFYKPGRVFE